MCSVTNFALTIVNQFMVIKFTLIGYYRTRYVFTKQPKNSFFEYIFEISKIIKFCSVVNVTILKTKHLICSFYDSMKFQKLDMKKQKTDHIKIFVN